MDIIDFEEEKKPEGERVGVLANKSEVVQISIAIGIVFVLMLLVQSLTELMLSNYYNISTKIILEDVVAFMEQFGHDLNVFRLAQMINTLVVFGGGAIMMSYLITKTPFGFFKFNSSAKWTSLIYVPFMMMSVLPIAMVVQHFISMIPFPEKWLEMQETMGALQKGMLGDASLSTFAVNLVMIAVLPAICEELLFRGILQRLFIRATGTPHVGIVITGFVFGLIHMQIINLLPIAILGILLGYLYHWTQNIWFPILAHFFFNGMQALGFFMATKNESFNNLEEMETLPIGITLAAIAVFAASTYIFYSANKPISNG
ncbi:MAG: type II CAAX endopeptidase family protein [Chitinophagales bacterium]